MCEKVAGCGESARNFENKKIKKQKKKKKFFVKEFEKILCPSKKVKVLKKSSKNCFKTMKSENLCKIQR